MRHRWALGLVAVVGAAAVTVAQESSPLAETGAPVDPAGFAYSRPLIRMDGHAPSTPDAAGRLVVVQLDAHVLAHSRGRHGRFSDLRVVDDEGRQVPYVHDQDLEPMRLDVTLTPREGPSPPRSNLKEQASMFMLKQASVYDVTLPYPRLPGMRLELETTERVFDRRVRVAVEGKTDRRRRDSWLEILAELRWSHADPDTPAPPLVLPLRELETTELLLTLYEGDNRPLSLSASRLQLPSHRLRFRAPDGAPLRLYYGQPDLGTPSYDIALVRDELLGGEATTLSLGEVAGASMDDDASLMPRWLFGAMLAAVVIALLALIARLVRAPA